MISGFPEWLPGPQRLFDQWKTTVARTFEQFGYCPLDTPAVERLETLLTKGEDHEIYGLYRLGEKTDARALGLRFDLTVPLARYVAEHHARLVFPYRRFHIAPVWRGERPQEGRFRQFYQCDIDVVGNQTLALQYDAEVALVMMTCLQRLNLGAYHFFVNHRAILRAWAKEAGLLDMDQALRLIDKRGKIPFSSILETLSQAGAHAAMLDLLVQWHAPLPWHERIAQLKRLSWGEAFHAGIDEVLEVMSSMETMGIPSSRLVLDPLLARGLSYYSGTVWEVVLEDHADLGTICAGGRYAHLCQSLGGKGAFPGVGMSLGLTRLFSRFVHLTPALAQACPILVTVQCVEEWPAYWAMGQYLRSHGLSVEVYLAHSPLSSQLKYAHRKGVEYVLIANGEELTSQVWHIKNLRTGHQETLALAQIPSYLERSLKTPCHTGGGSSI